MWHWTKNFAKAISQDCKSKDQKELLPWISHIKNHIWYSSTTCNGDAELLVEMVKSMPLHISNVHAGFNGHEKFTRCHHDPIER